MKNRGMTLFIAIVIMSVLLFISFAVVNITIKGTLFASSGRDSQYAFYAADSGIECALYWDSKFDPSKFDPSNSSPSPITCANQISNVEPFCVTVEVTKNIDGTTYIKSKGYNTCDMSNLKRVERGVEVTY
jgi:hypothetical protein